MRTDRRSFLAALAAMPLAMPALKKSYAATPIITASLLGPDKPETLIWVHIRDAVERQLPGRFTFNIVPDAALGGEKEVTEGIRLGSIQASLSTLSNLSTWVPQTQLFDLPFLFQNADHLETVLEGSCGHELSAKLAREGIAAPAFINYGARHLLSREPLLLPEDMQAKRIRVIQSPLHAQLWEGFGAHPIALPITETYNALSTGHVDAMDLTLSAYAGFRLYEVVPQVTLTGHIHAAGAVIFSGRFWKGLDEEARTILQKAAMEGARHFNALMAADEQGSIEIAQKEGATFHEVSERSAWQAPAQKVWEDFAGHVGGMERIEAAASNSCRPN